MVAVALAAICAACAGKGHSGRAPSSSVVGVHTTEAAQQYDSAIHRSRALLRSAVRDGGGVAVAVYQASQPVWVEGIGRGDEDAGSEVDAERTRFRIYSVAKAMTATAAARLAERRALDPSAPVREYVPTFPRKSAPITAMQLATHTSGIRHYADESEASGTLHCETIQDALNIFQDDPLLHAPGAGETYSSWGYVLLSAVVASAADAPFQAAMRRLVFDPAAMRSTTMERPDAPLPSQASFYEESGGELRPARAVDNTCKWGAGAYLSTAGDVARFGAAMLDGTLLSPRSLQLFLRGGDEYTAQGVGVGGTAFLLLDAPAELSIAVLTNLSGDTVGPQVQAALEEIRAAFSKGPQEAR